MLVRIYRKSTIKDVASLAKVSVTTVSHFVSGRHGACSTETAERIRSAIESLHYTPGLATRGQHQQNTNTIGICPQNPVERAPDDQNEYVTAMWRGITLEAGKRDYSLLLYPPRVRRGGDYRPFLDGRVDGVLMDAGHGDLRPAHIAKAGMPIVTLTRSLDLSPGCGTAYVEERDTVNLALSHLWSLGHRRIAHLAGPARSDLVPYCGDDEQNDIAIQRRDHFQSWLTERGAFDPLLVTYENGWYPSRSEEIAALWRALPRPPTAVFCTNDAFALGLIAACQKLGWDVPRELSVVGVDNTSAGAASLPPLTSVAVPVEAVGRAGVQALFKLMEGAPAEECRVAVGVSTLVVRGSTAFIKPA